ncbi:MAG: replication factor C large subunit [Nanoarchaeota archaeon]
MTWVEKYRPNIFEDIKGQDEAIEKIKNFIEEFNLSKITGKNYKKALILHGSPGVGKTTITHVMAKEINSEIFELNASDLRNRDKINNTLKPAIEQISLVKKSKLILVDEVDGISIVDRGGLDALLQLIDSSYYPIIITANNIWDKRLSSLRKKAEMVKLKELSYNTIKNVMNDILKKENIQIDEDSLKRIAIKARGDLRAAINDLQTLSKLKDVSSFTPDERNKEIDIFNALRMIFKDRPTNELLNLFDSVNLSIDEIILWVEENIPSEYNGVELARAYDLLSKTDVFRGRIHKQQYWRFLIYENIFLSYGIASSKKNFRTGFTGYKRPSRILKIWLHNQKTAKKKSIAQKYAKYVHVGEKRALHEFPLIKNILRNENIRKELKLSDEETEYLKNN